MQGMPLFGDVSFACMTLAERLQESLSLAGANQSELARAVGIRPASVNDWVSGKTREIEAGNLLRAAAFLKVRPEWLAMGKGPMRRDGSDPEPVLTTAYWPFAVDQARYERAAPDIGPIIDAVLVAQVEHWEREQTRRK